MSKDDESEIQGQDRLHESSYSEVNRESLELPDYEEDKPDEANASAKGVANKKTWIRLLLCLLLLLAILVAGPVYRFLKSWRADTLIEKSGSSFAYGDEERGMGLLKQAMALSPGNDSVGRAVEIFNARLGNESAHKRLLERMNKGVSTQDELLGIAELESKRGSQELALQAIGKLPKRLTASQRMRVAMVHAALTGRKDGVSAAASVCLAAAENLKGDDASRLRIQAGIYLLADSSRTQQIEGARLLMRVMSDKSTSSLAAARILARVALQNDQAKENLLKIAEANEVAQLLPSLPGHKLDDDLLAADLAIHLNPSSRGAIVARLEGSYQNAPRKVMLDFARWLNSQGLHDEVISFAGPDRPQSDTDWLLIVLDALCAKGEWDKIDDFLATPAGLGIPDAVKHMFLARVALKTGDPASAEEEWRSVHGSLKLEKPETLAYIAGYEEQIGALEQAYDAYKELSARKETHIPGLIGMIRIQSRFANPELLIPIYQDLVSSAPDYLDAAGDLAYLKLLNNYDLVESAASAESLLAKQPDSLARISVAALGRLKAGNPSGALALYDSRNIDWSTAPDPWKAVYVSVLQSSGHVEEAQKMKDLIRLSSLNPQELQLLNPTLIKTYPGKP